MRNTFSLVLLVCVVIYLTSPASVVAQIEATMEDEIQVDQDNDTRADPGDTLRYTITITHPGVPTDPDATNLQVTVPLDANTTLVPGGVRSTPVGIADRFETLVNGRVTITVSDASTEGVLANDVNLDGDPLTVVDAGTPQTTTLGGKVIFTANGGFTYTPPQNATGVDTFTYTVTDPDGTDPTPTIVTIGLNVNVAPSFVAGPNQRVREDSGPHTVAAWATALSTGPPHEAGQRLRAFLMSTTNDALFTTLPTISTVTGDLTYTPAPDAHGTVTVTVRLQDNGGTAGGGMDTSAPQTFTITITPVNDAPAFTAGPAQAVLEDAGAQTVRGWATGIAAGPANEARQTLRFRLTPDNVALFSVPPTIDPGSGDLSYTPAPQANGTATVTVRLRDNGGTADRGVDTSAPQTLTITVTPVNDPPSFVAGPAQIVPEDAGAQTVAAWATARSTGPANEAGQALAAFLVSTDNDALFAVLPAITPGTGTLTYTPAADANGVANVMVRLRDNGGIANGGVDTSALQTFTITVTAVNDGPVNSVPAAQTSAEDTPFPFSAATANLLSISDPDGASGPLIVTMRVTQGDLTLNGTQGLTFTTGDGTADTTMTFSGTLAAINTALDGLRFTPPLHFSGPSTLRLTTTDPNGPGGALSDTDQVRITVTAANDAPENTVPGAQSTPEDVALVFNAANSNVLSVSDIDAGSGLLEVTLSGTNALLTLSGTTGLTFTNGNGSNDPDMTFTGTLAAINTALDGLVLTPSQNFVGDVTLQLATNDQGNSGSGGPRTDTDTVIITVTAVNDAPVNSIPAAQSTPEDVALVFNAANSNLLGIADVDAGGSNLEVTLRLTPAGTLRLSSTAGLTFSAGDGTDDASMTFTGTLAAINTALDGMLLIPPSDFADDVTLQLLSNDQGNTGAGGPQSDTDSVSIAITAVNDAPVNAVPGAQATLAGVALTFNATNNNLLRISDIDAGVGLLTVTLRVTSGDLTLSSTAGLTFTTGNGSNDPTMTFSGTQVAINTALDGLVFTPASGFDGSVTLELATDDQGNTGSGGPQHDTDTVTITVSGVNDAPVNTVPGAQTTPEDIALAFSAPNGNAISISDSDAGSGLLEITLSVTTGLLTLGNTSGLTFSSGDGITDISMAFTGTLADINTAIEGLVFTPDANASGASTLQIVSNDQGNTGSGGPQTDTDTVLITLTAVNDAPSNSVPGAQSTPEDVALTFNASNSNLLSISDVDAGSLALEVSLSVTVGTLTLSSTAGLTFTFGKGIADASMTFTGTLTDINAAVDGLLFTPPGNFRSTSTLQVVTNDLGHTGSGGPLSDTDTVLISVTAVNDAPVNNVPAAQDTSEEVPLVFNTANGNVISISDVDAGTGALAVTLSVTAGSLSVNGTAGLIFIVGTGANDATMTFTGTLADINAALDGLVFTPSAHFTGNSILQLVTDDQGNRGAGGPQTDSDTVTIRVAAINDAPELTAGTTLAYTENQIATALEPTLTVSDVDTPTLRQATVQITANYQVGEDILGFTDQLGITGSFAAASGILTLAGPVPVTLGDFQTALRTVTYRNTSDTPSLSPRTITWLADDGQAVNNQSAPVTSIVLMTAANDAPVNTVPGAQTTDEDVVLVFNGANSNLLSISDVDVGSGDLAVTLDVTSGTLTLSDLTGLTFTLGDGTNNATMIFTGPLPAINTALDGLRFRPQANSTGSSTLTLTTDDQGNTGSGGALSDTDPVTITIAAVNDAPINSVPGAQSTDEDVVLVFNAANSNLISISDVDVGSNDLAITLDVTQGRLTLRDTTGLTFTLGDGTNNATMIFTGPLPAINTALDGLRFRPQANSTGSSTLTLTTDDQGNTGSGGALSDTDPVTITIAAVNDAPVNSVPGAQNTDEDVGLVFNAANSNLLSISDVDVGSSDLEVTLGVTLGSLTLSSTAGLTFTVGNGTNDASMTFTGSLAAINTALDGLSFQPVTNAPGSSTLTLTTDDQGNTGSGGALSDTDTVTITIAAVNDAPVNSVPGAQNTDEDVGLVFNAANSNLLSISDVDVGSSDLEVTLGVTLGSLTLSSTAGLTFTVGNGTNDASMTFTGSLAAINTALDGLSFQLPANDNGSSTLTLTTDDQGNTGSGGALSDTDTVAITITAVNDAPSFSAANPPTVNEDAGAQTVAGWATFNPGAANEGGQTVLAYTVSNISNGALFSTAPSVNTSGTLTYTPAANANGTSTFDVVVRDSGGTANGGIDTSPSQTFTITVQAVNDVPSFTASNPPTVNEDAGAQTVAGWATFNPGAANESGQTVLAYTVSSISNAALFSASPSVNTSGTLTYTPAANANGTSTFQVTVRDNGGTANGGVDTSPAQTFTITVTAVNDVPSFTRGANQTVAEDAGAQSVVGWATLIADGDPEAAQMLTFNVTGNTNPTLFSVGPSVNATTGNLTYTPAANANGSATITLTISDNGGTANGGVDTSPSQSFTITVTAVNDPPVAAAQSYNAQANMGVRFSGLLTGATDPDAGDAGFTPVFQLNSVSSCAGCTVSIANAATGTLDFVPSPGTTGIVTFTYQIEDNGRPGVAVSAAATVTVTISGPVIWFVDDSAAAGGNGTLNQPFQTLGSVAVVDNANDRVFLFSGVYATGLALLSGEQLIGQGVTGASFDAVFGITPPEDARHDTVNRPGIGGTRPVVQNTITLNTDAVVRGLNLATTTTTALLDLAGATTGVTVNEVDITASGAEAVSFNDLSGTVTLGSTTSGGGSANVSLVNVAGTVSLGTGALSGASSTAFNVNGGTGTISYAGSVDKTAAGAMVGRLVSITGKTGGSVALSGSLAASGAGATGLLVQNNSAGAPTISFTGTSKSFNTGTSAAITLDTNTGATITFSGGGLVINTTSGTGFSATGGGTVNVTGTGNTITSTTGTALNVVNTTIGASDLTFRSIDTTASSANAGVILINTGLLGGLTVTGTGSANSGGTISNKTGGNVQSGSPPTPNGATTGVGFYLSNTAQVSLTSMHLQNFSNHAIFGVAVTDFTLASSTVNGVSGDVAGFDESSVYFIDGAGTYTISNSNIAGGFQENLSVLYSGATARVATYNVTGTTFRDLQAAGQNAQVKLISRTTASTASNVTFNFTSGCVFENDANTLPPGSGTENWSDGILTTFSGPFQHTLNVQNNTFHHLFQGLDIASDFSADVNYIFRNNSITFTEGVAAIAIGTGSTATASVFITALIQGNTIGTSGVPQSGSRLGGGIGVDMRGEETAQFTLHQNVIRRIDVGGIDVINQTVADGNLDIQITDNVIEEVEDDVGAGVSDGIRVLTNTGTNHDICLDIRNNDSFAIGSGDHIQVRQSNAGVVFALEGFTGAGTSTAAVEAYIESQNPLIGTGARVRTVASIVNYTGANCTTPAPQ